MTAELYRGSNTEAILAEITGAWGVEQHIGQAEAARTGAPPRVTWVPGPRKRTPTVQQRAELASVQEVAPLFRVHLWGSSYTECEELEAKLEETLNTLFSTNAYEVTGDTQVEGDNETIKGSYLFIVPVRFLKIPLAVESFQRVTLRRATGLGVVDPNLGDDTPGTAVAIPGAVPS